MRLGLVNMGKLLRQARESGKGCGSFSVYSMEALKGTLKAAEEMGEPLIIQLAEARFKTAPLELVGPMMINAAEKANVEVAVHLDHGSSLEVVERALDMGFTSVMYDGSSKPFEENVKATKMVKQMAERYGADVEAELGLVGRSEDGTCDYGIKCTIPADAKVFAEETGVEALAIAIGNQHGNYPAAPKLRFDILRDIHQMIPQLPLVLHGGSGITDEDFRQCIRDGILKINIATAILNEMMADAGAYFKEASDGTYYDLSRRMTEGAYRAVKHHMEVFSMKNI